MYAKYVKRLLDFLLSLFALTVLSPFLLIFTVIGAIVMKGNPFFVQARPGRNEKIFKLIKFRTMTNKKGADGKLLPDAQRLTKYGKILRAKGIVNGENGSWVEFDYVPEEHEVRTGHPDYTGRLCVIGAELDEHKLAELFGL